MDVGLENLSVLLVGRAVKRNVVNSVTSQHNLDDRVLLGAPLTVRRPTPEGRRDNTSSARRGDDMPTRPEPADAEPMSQTSVRFPRMMLKRAKIRAATDEISLQALLISALNAELERRDKVEARKQ